MGTWCWPVVLESGAGQLTTPTRPEIRLGQAWDQHLHTLDWGEQQAGRQRNITGGSNIQVGDNVTDNVISLVPDILNSALLIFIKSTILTYVQTEMVVAALARYTNDII